MSFAGRRPPEALQVAREKVGISRSLPLAITARHHPRFIQALIQTLWPSPQPM